VSDIFEHPAHPYTRALMACRPEISRAGEPLQVISGQVPSPGQWPDGCHFALRCPLADQHCEAAIAAQAWTSGNHLARCIHVDSDCGDAR